MWGYVCTFVGRFKRTLRQNLPAQPFTFELWMWNLAFILLVSATVTTVTDYSNEQDFVNDRWVSRWLKGAYMNAMGGLILLSAAGGS